MGTPPQPFSPCPSTTGKSGNWPHFGHFSQPESFSLMPWASLNPKLTAHPSKQPLIKQKKTKGGGGEEWSWGGGQAQDRSLDGPAAQPLLAGCDRVDGQQTPELEVLDHRELLQALRGGGEERRVRPSAKACSGPSGLQGTPRQHQRRTAMPIPGGLCSGRSQPSGRGQASYLFPTIPSGPKTLTPQASHPPKPESGGQGGRERRQPNPTEQKPGREAAE